MILGGWKKPLSGFLFVNLTIFWLFYLSELPFSYLYEDSLRNYYLLALQRESILYVFIFLLFPDKDLRFFCLRFNSVFYFFSIALLLLEFVLLDSGWGEYSENTNKGSTFFELGTLFFVLSSWNNKILSRRFILGLLFVCLLTFFSGKRMALSFVFMRILYSISLSSNLFKYYFIVLISFFLLTVSSFLRDGIFDIPYILSNAVLSSNHGGVLHAGGMYLEASEIISWKLKFKLLYYNLVAPWFVSLRLLPLESSINLYFIENFREIQGNGGFISSYLKFFGADYILVLLIAFTVKLLKNNYFIGFFGVIVFLISNRFFYYNLASSIRLMSLTLLIYGVFILIIFIIRYQDANYD